MSAWLNNKDAMEVETKPVVPPPAGAPPGHAPMEVDDDDEVAKLEEALAQAKLRRALAKKPKLQPVPEKKGIDVWLAVESAKVVPQDSASDATTDTGSTTSEISLLTDLNGISEACHYYSVVDGKFMDFKGQP